jgi:hypothetical protein
VVVERWLVSGVEGMRRMYVEYVDGGSRMVVASYAAVVVGVVVGVGDSSTEAHVRISPNYNAHQLSPL